MRRFYFITFILAVVFQLNFIEGARGQCPAVTSQSVDLDASCRAVVNISTNALLETYLSGATVSAINSITLFDVTTGTTSTIPPANYGALVLDEHGDFLTIKYDIPNGGTPIECTFILTGRDVSPPVIDNSLIPTGSSVTCLSDINADNTMFQGGALFTTLGLVTDNCTNFAITGPVVNAPNDICVGGNIALVWTVTDAVTNTITFTQNVTLDPDVTSPALVNTAAIPLAPITVCDSNDPSAQAYGSLADLISNLVDDNLDADNDPLTNPPGITDNCQSLTLGTTQEHVLVTAPYIYKNVYTIQDGCPNNTLIIEQTINLTDAPVIATMDATADCALNSSVDEQFFDWVKAQLALADATGCTIQTATAIYDPLPGIALDISDVDNLTDAQKAMIFTNNSCWTGTYNVDFSFEDTQGDVTTNSQIFTINPDNTIPTRGGTYQTKVINDCTDIQSEFNDWLDNLSGYTFNDGCYEDNLIVNYKLVNEWAEWDGAPTPNTLLLPTDVDTDGDAIPDNVYAYTTSDLVKAKDIFYKILIHSGTVGCSDFDFNDYTVNFGADSKINEQYTKVKYAIVLTLNVEDFCGNLLGPNQVIFVVRDEQKPTITTAASDETVTCSSTSDFATDFQNWITNNGGAVATDQYSCTADADLTWTAYKSGTYGTTNIIYDGTIFPAALCLGNTDIEVDFVVEDECGNFELTTASFIIDDTQPPTLTNTPVDVTFNTSDDAIGDCSYTYTFQAPIITDDCNLFERPCVMEAVTTYNVDTDGDGVYETNNNVLGDGTGGPTDLLDPIQITFDVQDFPQSANGDVELVLDFFNVDGEDSNEVFEVVGEDGNVFFTTTPKGTQCSDISFDATDGLVIPEATFNTWAADDGLVLIIVRPKLPTGALSDGANNICTTPTTLTASLNYDCQQPSIGGSYNYKIFDDTNTEIFDFGGGLSSGQSLSYPFDVGSYTVRFYTEDCVANAATSEFDITIVDDEAPIIVCPSNLANFEIWAIDAISGDWVDQGNINNFTGVFEKTTTDCQPLPIYLSKPVTLGDNCGINEQNLMGEATNLTFTEHPNFDGYVLDDFTVDVPIGAYPYPMSDMVTIEFDFKGDLNGTETGESFVITDEDGGVYAHGQTSTDCGTYETIQSISIPREKVVSWLKDDGMVTFEFTPVNASLPVGSDSDWDNDDSGINPCVTEANLVNGNEDPNTSMRVRIIYDAPVVNYTITNADDPADNQAGTFPINGDFPIENLGPGLHTVTYSIQDDNLVTIECSYDIDIIRPEPTITLIPNTATGTCLEEVITIEETTYVATANTKWNWYKLNTVTGIYEFFTQTNVNTLDVTVTADVQNYRCSITETINGFVCESELDADIVTINDGVFMVKPEVSANTEIACAGTSFELQIDNNSPIWSFIEWEGPDGYYYDSNMGDALNPPAMTVTNASQGYYIAYAYRTGPACVVSDTVYLNVPTTSISTVSASSYTPGDGTCVDGTTDALMQITETNPHANNTYNWTGPNGYFSHVKNALIPNVTTTDNGTYYLTITDQYGCEAPVANIVIDVKDVPVRPTISVDGGLLTLCQGDDLILNTDSYTAPSVSYDWLKDGVSLGMQTSVPTLSITGVMPLASGDYSVQVTIDGCISEISDVVTILVNPTPATPSITGETSYCQGEEVVLTTIEQIGYTYAWMGPNGVSTDQNYVLGNMSTALEGTYELVLKKDGCSSDIATLVIAMDSLPTTPIITGGGDMCLADADREVTLEVSKIDAPNYYEWYDSNGDLFQTGIDSFITLDINSTYPEGQVSFTVIQYDGICVSEASNPMVVNIHDITNEVAYAGADINVCDATTTFLNATIPNIAVGHWEYNGSESITIIDPTNPNTEVIDLEEGKSYDFEWKLSNESCLDFATDIVKVFVNNTTGEALVGEEIVSCTNAALLSATAAPTNSMGTWSQTLGQASTGVTILDINDPASTIINLEVNKVYSFTWTLSNAGCGDYASAVQTVSTVLPSTPSILGQTERTACAGDDFILETNLVSGSNVVYHWILPNLTQVTTSVPQLEILEVDVTNSGIYTLVIEDGCESLPSEAVTLTVVELLDLPIITGIVEYCQGDQLILSTDEVVGATYEWTGPNTFTANTNEIIIDNVQVENAGDYLVKVTTAEGCSPGYSRPTSVIIHPNPISPILTGGGDLCLDDASGSIDIVAPDLSGSMEYIWYDENDVEFMSGTNTSFTIDATTTLAPGVYSYYVILKNGDCISEPSNRIEIEIFENPDISAYAGEDINLCDATTIILDASMPTKGTGEWIQYAGPAANIIDALDPNTEVTGLQVGSDYLFEWKLSYGPCANYSSDFVEIRVNSSQTNAEVIDEIQVCEGEPTVLLYAVAAPNHSIGTWTQSTVQANSGIVIVDPTDPTTEITGMVPGNDYLFDWVLSNTACGDYSSAACKVTIFQKVVPDVFANSNLLCKGDNLELTVNNDNEHWISFHWTGPDNFESFDRVPPIIEDVNSDNAGLYSLTVENGLTGCSTRKNIIISVLNAGFASISSTSVSGNTCVDGTDNVYLTLEVSPVDIFNTYTYAWTGPNGFTSDNKNIVLSNASLSDAGIYTVKVFDQNGCGSNAQNVNVELVESPSIPAITVENGNLDYCEGDDVTFSSTGYNGTDVVYYWNTPWSNGIQSDNPSLILENIDSLKMDGGYEMYVVVDGCSSPLSNEINLIVKPKPLTPYIYGDRQACQGQPYSIATPFVNGATYDWTGSEDASLNTSASLDVLDAQDNLTYTVQTIINGCKSDVSEQYVVEVNETPSAPFATSLGDVCMGESNPTIQLEATTDVANVTFYWTHLNTGQVYTSTSNQFSLTVGTAFEEGVNTFEVYAIADGGCTSEVSNVVEVDVVSIPQSVAFAGNDMDICSVNTVELQASSPSVGTGEWTQVSGPAVTIINPDEANTMVTGLQTETDYLFRWTLSNSVCSDFSYDEVALFVNANTDVAVAGNMIEVCDQTTAQLVGNVPGANTSGMWIQPASQSSQGVVITNPTSESSMVQGLSPGKSYEFTWTFSNNGCGVFSSSMMIIRTGSNDSVDAGGDFNACGIATINATPSQNCSGYWSSNDPEVYFADPTSSTTQVFGLSNGLNSLLWNLDCGICGNKQDEVIVDFEGTSTLQDDSFEFAYGESTDFDVTLNDIINQGSNISVVESPVYGSVVSNGDGTFTYVPSLSNQGYDEFVYEVCSSNCNDLCATAIVKILINIDDNCEPPNIITPNGDGYNDAFVIPCLNNPANYPNSELVIFNQYGDEVYRSSPYYNDWEGTYNGDNLPSGTYYYVLSLDGKTEYTRGFIVIER